jgi:hypothetical protein
MVINETLLYDNKDVKKDNKKTSKKKSTSTKKKGPLTVKTSPELKLAKKINKEFVREKLTSMLRKPMFELAEIAKDDLASGMDAWLAKIITIGVQHGDHARLNFMFDRIIGKVTEVKEIQIAKPFMIESHDGSKTITLGTDEVSDGSN